MKKITYLTLILLFLVSCFGCGMKAPDIIKEAVKLMPHEAFDTVEYDRTGLWSSSHIEAHKSTIENGRLILKDLTIREKIGHVIFNIKIKGLKRQL